MSKDIFNGNIKKEHINYVKYTLLFSSIFFFAACLYFLLTAIFYENIEYAAKIFLFILSGLSFLSFVLCPILSIYAIKTYPKHPKLAKLLIKEFVFTEF